VNKSAQKVKTNFLRSGSASPPRHLIQQEKHPMSLLPRLLAMLALLIAQRRIVPDLLAIGSALVLLWLAWGW
jgi:hypothetical protein